MIETRDLDIFGLVEVSPSCSTQLLANLLSQPFVGYLHTLTIFCFHSHNFYNKDKKFGHFNFTLVGVDLLWYLNVGYRVVLT